MAKLSFGLFLAGFLAFPLIAAFAPLPTIVAIISALALLLLAFVFGLASWPELHAKIVVITTGILFAIGLGFIVVSLPFFVLKTRISNENPTRLNQQIETMPTEAKAQLEPLPGYDFTSPRTAMESTISAARDRNARVFRRGFSKSFKAKAEEDGESLDQFGDFGKCTVISGRTLDKTNAEVVVEANDGSHRRFTFWMILEDGEWKLNELGSKPSKE